MRLAWVAPNFIKAIALLVLCAPLCACDAASPRLAESAPITWSAAGKAIVLVTPDIELSELTAGGAEAPRADWTGSATDLTRKKSRPPWRARRGGDPSRNRRQSARKPDREVE